MGSGQLRSSEDFGVGAGQTLQLVVFRIDARRYALQLGAVQRIVQAVAVTPLPRAPQIVLGIIDLAGCVVPVLNMRQRLQLPQRPLRPADHFVIARTAHRLVALVIDGAEGVIHTAVDSLVRAGDVAPGVELLRGVVQLPDGLVLIQDLDRFLSLEESAALDSAMERSRDHGS